jgi:hypothetical protein
VRRRIMAIAGENSWRQRGIHSCGSQPSIRRKETRRLLRIIPSAVVELGGAGLDRAFSPGPRPCFISLRDKPDYHAAALNFVGRVVWE